MQRTNVVSAVWLGITAMIQHQLRWDGRQESLRTVMRCEVELLLLLLLQML